MPTDPSPNLTPQIAAQLAADAATAATADHIGRNMQDIPPVYRQAMPVTANPAELAAAEKTIRAQYQADKDQFDGNARQTAAPRMSGQQADAALAALMKGQDLNGRMPDTTPPRLPAPKSKAAQWIAGYSSANDLRKPA